jgi:hypothetical protein
MTQKPETRLQRRIVKALKKAVGGWWAKMYVGPCQQAGIPDLLGCVQGLFFALEVKVPGEEPSEIQIKTMRDIRTDGGAIARTVTSPEQAVRVVLKALERAEKSLPVRAAPQRDKPVLRPRNRQNLRDAGGDGRGKSGRIKLPSYRGLLED